MQQQSKVELSIHKVRPVRDREEALDYLREMCAYWYEKRPAFPGSPEALFQEMARMLPGGGTAPVSTSAPHATIALLELFNMCERVIRTNPQGPYVDQLRETLERVKSQV